MHPCLVAGFLRRLLQRISFPNDAFPRLRSQADSPEEVGRKPLTFYNFPAAQHKVSRPTNPILRLHEELPRQVKMPALPPGEGGLAGALRLVRQQPGGDA